MPDHCYAHANFGETNEQPKRCRYRIRNSFHLSREQDASHRNRSTRTLSNHNRMRDHALFLSDRSVEFCVWKFFYLECFRDLVTNRDQINKFRKETHTHTHKKPPNKTSFFSVRKRAVATMDHDQRAYCAIKNLFIQIRGHWRRRTQTHTHTRTCNSQEISVAFTETD